MCQKCDELAEQEILNKEEIYTLYFLDGKRIVLKGKNFSDGWNKAQAALHVPLYAKDIEWMDRGETDTHFWLIVVNSWRPRVSYAPMPDIWDSKKHIPHSHSHH